MDNQSKGTLIKKFARKKTEELSDTTILKSTKFKDFLEGIGQSVLFTQKVFRNIFTKDFEWNQLMIQSFQIGNKSLGLIGVTGIIIGIVLTIQSRPVLVDFGAVTMLPGMVTVSLIREMGPVITALICAGKIGSSMGAEIGSMRVTEQIDAMEVSSTNPFKFIIIPRVLAATLMLPILVIYADFLGILGSWIAANFKGDVTFTLFISQAFASISFSDIIPATIKTFFFGFVIGMVGCYKGYFAGRGTESVGIAANSAVVMSSLLVIIVDLIAVQITDLI